MVNFEIGCQYQYTPPNNRPNNCPGVIEITDAISCDEHGRCISYTAKIINGMEHSGSRIFSFDSGSYFAQCLIPKTEHIDRFSFDNRSINRFLSKFVTTGG